MSKKFTDIFLGNKATIIGIIIIIFMAFLSKSIVPEDNRVIPEKIVFLGHEYFYEETIKASSFSFFKAKEGSKEGFRILIGRKDKKAEIPEQVYIYLGKRVYLKYIKE